MSSLPADPVFLTRDAVESRLPELPSDAQTLARLMISRYSCRAFRSDPVPHATLEQIVEIAQLTASWSNVQPWQVVITEGEGTRRFAAALYAKAMEDPTGLDFDFDPPPGPPYEGIYDERRKQCGIQLYTSLGIQRGDRQAGFLQAQENFRLFGAPHAAIITTDRRTGLYGAIDTGGYLAAFLLALQSFGIAAIPQASLARFGTFVHAHFALPEDRAILCGISFGYPDSDHPANGFRTVRADPRTVVRYCDA